MTLETVFPKLTTPRKPHRCRLCDQRIEEPCCSWSTVEHGDGYTTWYAHPECYQVTLDDEWDDQDWEITMPGNMERPVPNSTPKPL